MTTIIQGVFMSSQFIIARTNGVLAVPDFIGSSIFLAAQVRSHGAAALFIPTSIFTG